MGFVRSGESELCHHAYRCASLVAAATVALSAGVVSPAPAAAASATITAPDHCSSSGCEFVSYTLTVAAGATDPQSHGIQVDRTPDGAFLVQDSAGLEIGLSAGSEVSCTQTNSTSARCSMSPSASRNDDISGLAVAGGAGYDGITLNNTDGVATGGGGLDVMIANPSSAGRVEFRGGPGDDSLTALSGRAMFFGEAGEDLLSGATKNDFMQGGAGDDHLFGNAGSDLLGGGAGRDHVAGKSGADRLFGGSGADHLIARDGEVDRQINCGPGSHEVVKRDRRDPKPVSC